LKNKINISFIVLAFVSIGLAFLSFKIDSEEIDPKSIIYKNLKKALENPLEVYNLDLSNQKLKTFPEEIIQLKNLKSLNLSKNKLKEIPDEIGILKNLTYLNLERNNLVKLSEELGELVLLEELIISRNQIENLPASIINLENLKILDMWSNELEGFPEDMENMKSLEIIDIRGILFDINEIKSLEKKMPNTKIKYSNTCNCKF